MSLEVPIGQLIVDKGDIIAVNLDAKLPDVIRLFRQHNILGAPVYDSIQTSFVGIIDTFEIVRFTALGCYQDKIYHDDLFREMEFPNKTVSEVIARSDRCRTLSVFQEEDTLFRVMSTLTKEKRVLVRKQDHSYKLLSQSDIIAHLHANKADWKGLGIRISEMENLLHPYDKPVVSIGANDRAIEGFLKISDANVPAVAIVDEFGGIVGNLSASDLRGIDEDTINSIFLPAMKFLKLLSGSKSTQPICCSIDEELTGITSKLAETKVHRVWVVNWEGKPRGVISLTDVINTALKSAVYESF